MTNFGHEAEFAKNIKQKKWIFDIVSTAVRRTTTGRLLMILQDCVQVVIVLWCVCVARFSSMVVRAKAVEWLSKWSDDRHL